jgi:hypothetical protein
MSRIPTEDALHPRLQLGQLLGQDLDLGAAKYKF